MSSNIVIWIITILATVGVILRPWKLPEALWALSGALLLVFMKLISPAEAWNGIASGLDVYLFLLGMMILAEIARAEKLFEWMAAHAIRHAKGSPNRLFLLIYTVGIIVTAFLSNDATAVVLTPAVAAAMRAAKIQKPLPYLLICAFTANAASFVLPISNPANLVIYGSQMPSLIEWVPRYFFPSVAAIVVTFLILRLTQKKLLTGTIPSEAHTPSLSTGAITAATGIFVTAILLLVMSAYDIQLGFPTALAGVATGIIVLIRSGKKPWHIVQGISWSVLPLVAGLFVLVEALNKTGLIHLLSRLLLQYSERSVTAAAWVAGLLTAFVSNLTNNLPSGLIAGQVLQETRGAEIIRSSVLIGVDLGPNLSITGSLATILWLVALRREGEHISAWSFLRLGFLIMTTALLASLGALWL